MGEPNTRLLGRMAIKQVSVYIVVAVLCFLPLLSRIVSGHWIVLSTVFLCAPTQPAKLMQSIVSCAQLEDAVEEERLQLSSVEVDVEDVESFKHQLKGLYDNIFFLINIVTVLPSVL